MIPQKRGDFDIFDEMFKDPFFQHPHPHERDLMKTDIKENENNYQLIIDLPGYKKEDLKISVESGYLTVHAQTNSEKSEEDKGKFVRKERFVGECTRSFYVGDDIETEDVKANFQNGTLKLEIPKKEAKEISEKKYVQIED